MTATTKEQPKWKAWLRRQLRPRPYWQKRLDDQVEQPRGFWSQLWGVVNSAVSLWFLLVLLAVFLSLYISVVVVPVFFSPGFFEYGLADPLGRLYASICTSAGYCDLRYLMAGTTIGVIVLAGMSLPIFFNFAAPSDEDELTEDEMLDSLAVLDERIVQLRADLVIAGVLKVRPEEIAEVEDAPALPPVEVTQDLATMATSAREANERLIQTQAELERLRPVGPYVRPELTKEDQAKAGQLAVSLTGNKSTLQIRAAVAMLILENHRLLLEANEHRAARGLEPLATHEVGK